ncbi:MAG TPA: hypothetical protein DCS07_05490 [Bdellovibrionales bacterium]|nr:MAG: hypothetical protein A2Z97_04450 [Bdellovibrionales bacterium GWB1_52_6]OFZ02728.1 MAG: hypothetical protein A2X97_12360 [Bdellovibrionales bacterium GWA1_52_35]HAR42072.1 hypothetical protein [Bdellovibrionales bacterium]HCM41627.1 hypothetical protein [Bdellovibrionales bacterium]
MLYQVKVFRHLRLSALIAVLVLFSVNSEISLAESSVVGNCSPENGGLIEPSKWAQEMDRLGQLYLRRPQEDDIATTFGAIIDSSCTTGPRELKKPFTVGKIEKALSYAVSQLNNCQRAFGFRELPGIISILRRMVIICQPVQGHHDAEMRAIVDHGWSPSKVLFGRYTTSAAAEHDYQVSLQMDGSGRVGLIDPANVTSPETMAQQTMVLGSLLFHEALHALPANNTGWHLEGKAKARSANSCSLDPLFDDRIYFIQAACFPKSLDGQFYRGQIDNCPNLCESALTGIDANVKRYLAQGHSRIFSDGIYGPGLIAEPYKIEEAKIVCSKVREYGERKRTFDLAITDLKERLNEFGSVLAKVADSEFHTVAVQMNNTTRAISQIITDPSRAAQDLSSLKITVLLDQVRAMAKKSCSTAPENSICTPDPHLKNFEFVRFDRMYRV